MLEAARGCALQWPHASSTINTLRKNLGKLQTLLLPLQVVLLMHTCLLAERRRHF